MSGGNDAMYALVVVTPFQIYVTGDLITDPATIAAIEAGPYSAFVTRTMISSAGNGGEALTVLVPLATVGQPVTLSGQTFGSTPTALDYSTDGGNGWTPVFGYTLADGNWSGYGPSYTGPGNFFIMVRDHNAQEFVSGEVGFTVLAVLRTGDGDDPFSIVNYGGVVGLAGSGPDNSAALAAAFAAAGPACEEVVIPGGDWWFVSPVAMNGATVTLRGHGKGQTRLHFGHTGTALSIAPGSLLNRVTIRDMSLFAENVSAPTACAISVSYPSAASFGYQTTLIENVEVVGYPNGANGASPFPQTWGRGIVLQNCWASEIANCSWFGPPAAAGATTACFIEVNGSNDTQITDCSAYYGKALVIQTGYCQGLRITAPRVVGTDFVLVQSAQSAWTGYSPAAYSLQGLAILGGELNCNIGHVAVAGVLGGFVTAANITRRPQGPGSAQVLFSLTDSSDFHIMNCDWNGGPGGDDVAIQFQLGVLGNGSSNSMHGGHFANMATVLEIVGTNGAVGSVFEGFRLSNVPLATAIIDGSSASNGNLIYYPGPGGSNFPTGLISNKDFRWAGPDNTTLFRVQSIQAAANFWKIEAATASNPPLLLATGGDAQVNATIQTTGGNLYLSAAGDGVSGGLAAFTNLSGAVAWPTFQNATEGNLVVLATNTQGLSINPAQQLYLGGTALYAPIIGATTANPGAGAANKVWSNGGAVSVARGDGLNPLPSFQPAFAASQVFGDIPASSTIFSGGPIPTPPAALSGLLMGDRWKIGGVFSFAEWFAPNRNFDAWPALTNALLYAQLMYRAQCGTSLDNVAERRFVDLVLPAGDYLVSQPLYVPENVRLGGPGRILRAPYTGNQSNDGTDSVPGPFATNQYLPTVVVTPRAHLSDLNVYCTTDGVFAHRGSGVCLGKNWQAVVGGAVTIGDGGSNYSVGDLWVAVNPSVSPYSGWVAQVTSVDGAGGITAATVYLGGAYALPPMTYEGGPSLQAQQWTSANGFTVFDTANAGCFLMAKAYQSNFSTPSPGTGATLAPPWQADFATNEGGYLTGASLTCGSQAGRIQITGSIPDVYDATYGPSFNVQLSGLEFEIDSIQGLGGHVGLWADFAQDARIGRLNFVGSNIFMWARSAGSIECPNAVADTCGCVMVIDQSHGIRMHGRAFYEEGNIKTGAPAINPQGAAFLIGSVSTSSFPVSCLDLKFTVINMGGLPASTIASHGLTGVSASQQAACAQLSYLFSSVIDLAVSNISQYGGAPSPLPTSGIYQLGFNVDNGNDLRGSLDTVPTIDGVAPPAQIVTATSGHAFPGCNINVWDGLHQCRIGPGGVVDILGSAAPTGGTGVGFAVPTSVYRNIASGITYRNTGTLSAPAWSTP
jgi:hypothetical protein